jgi:large subunit ribosomal protein L14
MIFSGLSFFFFFFSMGLCLYLFSFWFFSQSFSLFTFLCFLFNDPFFVIILDILFLGFLLFSMIQTQTILTVADNSGAKTVKCIGFCSQLSRFSANIGDCIIVSVRTLKSSSNSPSHTLSSSDRLKKSSKSSLHKGQIFKALIIRTRRGLSNRTYGHRLSFTTNDVVLLTSQGSLFGSRIFGPLTRELRSNNFRQILSQSERIF